MYFFAINQEYMSFVYYYFTAAIFVDTPICNHRFIALDFQVLEASMLHGFAGYFDSTLYDDLHMSM